MLLFLHVVDLTLFTLSSGSSSSQNRKCQLDHIANGYGSNLVQKSDHCNPCFAKDYWSKLQGGCSTKDKAGT